MPLSGGISRDLYVGTHNMPTFTKGSAPAAHDVVLGAEELRYAAQAVGKVSGSIDVEDVLDSVFKDFCIGK